MSSAPVTPEPDKLKLSQNVYTWIGIKGKNLTPSYEQDGTLKLTWNLATINAVINKLARERIELSGEELAMIKAKMLEETKIKNPPVQPSQDATDVEKVAYKEKINNLEADVTTELRTFIESTLPQIKLAAIKVEYDNFRSAAKATAAKSRTTAATAAAAADAGFFTPKATNEPGDPGTISPIDPSSVLTGEGGKVKAVRSLSASARKQLQGAFEQTEEGGAGSVVSPQPRFETLPPPPPPAPTSTEQPLTPTPQPPPTRTPQPPATRTSRSQRTRGRSGDPRTDEALDTEGLAAQLLLQAVNKTTEAGREQTQAMQQAQQQAMQANPAPPPDEGNKLTDEQAAKGVDRQNELSANEVEALTYHDDYVEKLDVSSAHLVKDQDRGNLGAGTTASGPIADLWGNLPSQPKVDKRVPELLFDTKQDGTLIQGDTEAPEADKFTFLPFAKLGGSIVWIPRNAEAAKFFFTSQDYDELASNVVDGDTLTLAHEDMVDITYMLDSITKLFMSLHLFCNLAPMLVATKANRTQIYAEWLELRQLSRAIVAYQQNTAGMYENASISMRGGIRAAVGAALKPLYDKLKVPEPSEKEPVPGGTLGDKRKRIGNMGLVEDADYNPQFSFEPLHFKRTKFSIPII
jgi:hypothetical protein